MYDFLKGRLLIVRVILLMTSAVLIAIGIITIYAVGHPAQQSPSGQSTAFAGFWLKQLIFAAAGAAAFVVANTVNYRRLGALSYGFYAFLLLLLGLLLVDKWLDIPFVPVINNARRWLRVGTANRYIQVQPSEFCKLAFILALAWYLRYRSNYRNFRALIGPFSLTLLPVFLILAEPDLGTAVLMLPVLFVMLFIAGARLKHLLVIILIAVLFSPLLWYRMRPYQRTRISSVVLQHNWLRQKAQENQGLGKLLVGSKFSEAKWKNDWGYHLIRAKYAVASGRLSGYGYQHGPFIKYNFLPERHNDFIFAAIAQQWGFVGCVTVLALFVIIFICGLEIASYNTDPFGKLLVIGIAAMFTVEVLVNIGMTLGLMPITGLTLPLVSYGGSSLMVSMISIGLVNNVGRCRPFTVAART